MSDDADRPLSPEKLLAIATALDGMVTNGLRPMSTERTIVREASAALRQFATILTPPPKP